MMLTFIDENDFLLVETFQENTDGTVSVACSGWGGIIWPGFTRTTQVQTGTTPVVTGQDENGDDITEEQPVFEDVTVDVWAKYCELRDNGTITVQPVPQAELDAIAAEQAKQTERQSKLNAYTFKNVSCSVNESDQNGWETVNARVKRLVASGEAWRNFPFFMDNGNYILIESEAEWDAFVEAGWQAREAIMMARLSS